MTNKFIGLIWLIGLIGPMQINAAELFFDSGYDSAVRVGDVFEVSLLLDTQGEYINAVEGTVNIPPRLEAQSINNGDSLVSLWIQPPRIEQNKIAFAGIVPGGYSGARGTIFSIVLRAHSVGANVMTIEKAQTLLHDGRGTASRLATRNYNITIASRSTDRPPAIVLQTDREPPSMFAPIIAQDANVFGGKKFLVFVAFDKQSGVDHYEVREEGESNAWVVATSPYLLKDQTLSGRISVRAIDVAGNVRVAALGTPISVWYEIYWSWIALFVLFTTILIYWMRQNHRKGGR